MAVAGLHSNRMLRQYLVAITRNLRCDHPGGSTWNPHVSCTALPYCSHAQGSLFVPLSPVLQVPLHEPQERLEQRLTRIVIVANEDGAEPWMRAGHRDSQGPMIGVEVAHQGAAWDHLVVEQHLAIVAGIHAAQLGIAGREHGGDAPGFWKRHHRVIRHLARQRMGREPGQACAWTQAFDGAAVAGCAPRARPVLQEGQLFLVGVIRQGRASASLPPR